MTCNLTAPRIFVIVLTNYVVDLTIPFIKTLRIPFFDCRSDFGAAGGSILGDAGEVDFSCERGRTDLVDSPFVKEAGSKRFAFALMLALPFFVFAYLHVSRCIRSKLWFVIHVEIRISSQIIVCSQSRPVPISFLVHCWLRVSYSNGLPTMLGYTTGAKGHRKSSARKVTYASIEYATPALSCLNLRIPMGSGS